MTEYYLEIRWVHVAAVFASGGLFLLRGFLLMAGRKWARSAPLNYLSYTIDTVLLTAALMLMSIVRQYPFVHAWLTVKIVLLVVYIVLGYHALRPERTAKSRIGWFAAAVTVYLFIISVARAHHPLGILANL